VTSDLFRVNIYLPPLLPARILLPLNLRKDIFTRTQIHRKKTAVKRKKIKKVMINEG
jgi:hypothetical protein